MLAANGRLRDARVFTDSRDVVITPDGARSARRRLLAQTVDPALSTVASDDDDVADDERRRHPPSDRLHPQHPYNAQLLSAERLASAERRPMEFVFLPSGEIRPRDECPPGLALPPPAADDGDDDDDDEDVDEFSSPPRRLLADNDFRGLQKQQQRRQERRKAEEEVGGGHARGGDARAPSSEEEESESEPALSPRYPPPPPLHAPSTSTRRKAARRSSSSSSNGSEEEAQSESDEEKENARYQQQQQQATRKKKPSPKQAAVAAARKTAASSPATQPPDNRRTQPSRSDALADADRQARREPKKAPSGQEKYRRPPLASHSSASDDSRVEWSRRPKAVKYEDFQLHPSSHSRAAIPKNADDAATRPKKTAKMDVRDLLSENSERVVRALKGKPQSSSARDQLEQELQREKTRVLEKMTQLLEEQGKNQHLQHQLDELQAQLASKERETDKKVKDARQSERESLGQVEAQWKARVAALEDQLRAKDAATSRLTSENEQLRSSAAKLKERARQVSSQTLERDSSANLQLEKILSKLRKFHTRVENWKTSSKEAMDVCDTNADTVSLLEALWLDFPAFPLLELIGETTNGGEKRSDASDNANMVLFLKKRLRLREDELRRTHAKYVELKELCARQCVREADLQNFINEHRLRGNLVIRRKDEARGTHESDARKNVQFQEQQAGAQGSSKKKTIVSRATNTPAAPVYYESEDDNDNEEEEEEEEEDDVDYEEADDGEEEQQQHSQEDYYVRHPKVFVQVGRDGVYEHHSRSTVLRKLEEEEQTKQQGRKKREPQEVERIRLVPSPALARRFERVSVEDRSTAATVARRRPSGVTTPTRPTARLARPPPSISATRTSSVAARRKTAAHAPSSAGARANGTRITSVSSRLARAASAPWV